MRSHSDVQMKLVTAIWNGGSRRVIPEDAAATGSKIHCLDRAAYAAEPRAFCAQSDLLSRVLPLTP
jgi:hypothetical protein